ncbi:MAG: hypothetical protein KC413_15445 [Anaerolineales bacterium]|nr:hypothetical protein [Anaerolineales bacterium]MCA9977153.1 hypothetical protein [Anaerolineales bacterium]
MRPRTFILLILVVVVGVALAAVLILRNSGGSSSSDALVDTTTGTGAEGTTAQEPNLPPPTATPSVRFEPVVVARVNIPVGQRLTPELLEVETRPNNNIALQGGYTFANIEDLIGRIVKVEVSEGQAVLSPMIALNATDLASFGSDLALYLDQGRVAVAFPFSLNGDESTEEAAIRGAAFAMRPGDFIDVMMTLRILEIDPEFRTALPNLTQRVYQSGLLEGSEFLFPETVQGRLEFIPEINQVAEIIPSDNFIEGQDFEAGTPIPKRVTQLTIQQAEVIWVGTWKQQDELLEDLEPIPSPVTTDETAVDLTEEEGMEDTTTGPEGTLCVSPISNEIIECPIVREQTRPDVVILSMSSQDALALKWALERGVDIDLALRAQGDNTVFFTTSVSLPQIINEGGLAVPSDADFDLHPRVDDEDLLRPRLPDEAPVN